MIFSLHFFVTSLRRISIIDKKKYNFYIPIEILTKIDIPTRKNSAIPEADVTLDLVNEIYYLCIIYFKAFLRLDSADDVHHYFILLYICS